MTYTDQQLVERYLLMKALVARRKEELDTELAPYTKGLAAIENEFLRRLTERNAGHTKTDAGTAYKATIVDYKVVDQAAFLLFCQRLPSGHGNELFTVKAVKDGVRDFANGGTLPPGLEQTQFVRVNVRRT